MSLADDFQALLNSEFIAPFIPSNSLCIRFRGAIYTFKTECRDEGWFTFRPMSATEAIKVGDAPMDAIGGWLNSCKQVSIWLIRPLEGQTWLGYPANGNILPLKPVLVRLTGNGGEALQPFICGWDGRSAWASHLDLRSVSPMLVDELKNALAQDVEPGNLKLKGLTPSMRVAYQIAYDHVQEGKIDPDEKRLKDALKQAGGELHSFVDAGSFWRVSWSTPSGEYQTSAIAKSDLTVVSAGYCLDGEDEKFDLQSLVGVTEKRTNRW